MIVVIMIAIALLHFVTGSRYSGPFPVFVNGYLIDILLPFGLYLLLCLNDNALLESWFTKGFLIFIAAFLVEMAQYRGIPLFGRTFDPVDILMYGLGVLLAIGCDQFLFPLLFSFWIPKRGSREKDLESDENMFSWRQN